MKDVEALKPGVYKLPDGRTHTVLDVHDMHLDVSNIIQGRIKLRIQELLKKDAEKEAKNEQVE